MPDLVKSVHVGKGKKPAKKLVEVKTLGEDRQPDCASEDGTISDDCMSADASIEGEATGSGSGSIGSAMVTLTQADLEAMVESSQARMGKWLLAEHEKSWDRQLKKLEMHQTKVLDKKIGELRQDLESSLDKHVATRLEESERRMQTMAAETRKAVEEAKALLGKADSSRQSAAEVHGEASASGPWRPRTLEIKGFCAFVDRFRLGVSSDFVADYTEKLKNRMESESIGHIDWERTESANRLTFCFKIVLVLRENTDREVVYAVKGEIADILKDDSMRIRNSQVYCAAQASPGRREVYAAGGKYTNASESLWRAGRTVVTKMRTCRVRGGGWQSGAAGAGHGDTSTRSCWSWGWTEPCWRPSSRRRTDAGRVPRHPQDVRRWGRRQQRIRDHTIRGVIVGVACRHRRFRQLWLLLLVWSFPGHVLSCRQQLQCCLLMCGGVRWLTLPRHSHRHSSRQQDRDAHLT